MEETTDDLRSGFSLSPSEGILREGLNGGSPLPETPAEDYIAGRTASARAASGSSRRRPACLVREFWQTLLRAAAGSFVAIEGSLAAAAAFSIA